MTLFDTPTVVVQGITGRHGAFHTRGMLDAGTNVAAGVTPGKAGEVVHGVPVYNSVFEAAKAHPALNTSVVFVPAAFALAAVSEAVEANIRQVIVITEGIPVHDALKMYELTRRRGVTLVGPNCPGFIVPGSHKLGIIAASITSPGATAIISRSGTLTYELADALTKRDIGQSIILGIGGDAVPGMDFVDALELVNADPGTRQIVMVGEIGGTSEQQAADYVAQHVSKPIYGLVVGHSAPSGQTFGHAGAIIGARNESARAKTDYLSKKGVLMADTLDGLIERIPA